MQQSDRHCGGIERDHVQSTGGENPVVRSTFCRHKRDHVLPAGGGECSNQINIVELSEEITYDLQEGGEHSSQIHILEVSNKITYNLQDGKYAAIRSTFCRYQMRSRTVYRRGGNTAVRSTLRKHNERSRTVCRREQCSSQIDIA